jgi:hypothetical protein
MKKSLLSLCVLIGTLGWVSAQPVITGQSSSQSVAYGSSLGLSVTATGSGTLSYQWKSNNVAIPNETNSIYNIPVFQVPDVGTYAAIVSNSGGSTTSADIVLTSTSLCTLLSPTVKAWWQADDLTGSDYVGGNDGTVQSGVSIASGQVSNCFYFNGSSSAYVGLGIGVGNFGVGQFTIEFWEKLTNVTDNVSFIGNAPATPGSNFWQVGLGAYGTGLNFYHGSDKSNYFQLSATAGGNQTITNGWHHIAVTRTNIGGGQSVVSLYIDGNLDTNATIDQLNADQNSYGLRLGNDQKKNTFLTGWMDEIAIYTHALSPAEIMASYIAGTNHIGYCCSDITITNQPDDAKHLQLGDTATFTVGARGTATLSYQWSFNNTQISGATSSTFVTNVDSTTLGTYSVLVWNNCDAVQSKDVHLAVAPTTVSLSPTAQTTNYHDTFTFTANVAGSPTLPLTYQWYHNGSPVGHNSSQIVSTVDLGDGGSYSVVVCNDGGCATSPNALLHVTPHVVTSPKSVTNAWGQSVVFDPSIAGSDLGFQWWSTNAGKLNGKVAHSLTINQITNLPNPALDQFWVVATNQWGDGVQTTPATLYVSPGISNQPVSTSACDNTWTTFTCTAYGSGNVTNQWRFNGNDIADGANYSGVTNSTLSVKCNLTTIGTYTMVASNEYGSGSSLPVTLADNTAMVLTAPNPTNQTVYFGNVATINSAGNGNPQWYFNGSTIPGATTATLSLINFQAANQGTYSVSYSGTCGSVTSPVTAVVVGQSAACTTNFPNPIAFWKAEGDTSDVFGNFSLGVTGTVNYTNGHVGQGFGFNGTGSYLGLADTNFGVFSNSDFTIEFWITAPGGAGREIMSKRVSCDSTSSFFHVRLKSTGEIRTAVSGPSGAGLTALETINKVVDGKWHHYAFVRSGNVLTAYLDGAAEATSTVSTIANIRCNQHFRIGWSPCVGIDGTTYFKGALDEIAIYTNALSQSQIWSITNAPGGKCTP